MTRSPRVRCTALLVALSAAMVPASSRALVIDFTAAPWAAADGQSSYSLPYSIGGKTITVTVSASVAGTVLYQSSSGFGVTRSSGDYRESQVNDIERLSIAFDDGAPLQLHLNSAHLSMIFNEDLGSGAYREQGSYSLDGGTQWTDFMAAVDQTYPTPPADGVLDLTIDQNTDSVLFKAPGMIGDQSHEYSVDAIDINVAAPPARCSQPLSSGVLPTASDCLFILKAAVGLVTCSPECICAPTGSLPIVATDALLCLKKAVGQALPLNCPCP